VTAGDAVYQAIDAQAPYVAPGAVVFDVKRFATHDGPGIRTTVFFKGCPLACSWCHNPEGQNADPELMIDHSRCSGCGACAAACPVDAVTVESAVSQTDRSLCTACGRCIDVCPGGARSVVGHAASHDELVQAVCADALFYDESGGGVTVSGGEPLVQPNACIALLAACKQRGIHTALDTCGYADEAILCAAARYTDLFLYDIKLIDEDRHMQLTGVSNERILANARELAARHQSLWIRIPLVPSVNDDEESLTGIARFIATLESVEAVCLLPYHGGAAPKRERLGLPTETNHASLAPATTEDAATLLARHVRPPVRIGG